MATQSGDLECLVLQANNLKDLETFGKMDPYCKVELSGQKFQTKSKTDAGKKPVWNERFKFVNITPAYSTELLLSVYDHNVMMSDKLVGQGRCPLARIYQVGCEETTVQLVTEKGKSAGELQVVLTYKPYTH